MDDLITVEELATYLHFSKKTIYHMVKQKTLPVIQVGDNLRFSRSDIDEVLKRRDKAILHILVIDDNQAVCVVMRKILEDAGHVVITATTGAEGIEQTKEIKFDHIFLDMLMPDMNGVEALRLIRQTDSDIPVTIITGHVENDLMQQVTGYGVDRVMIKPFSRNDVLAAMRG
jgi:excisionase family DNA binding protein